MHFAFDMGNLKHTPPNLHNSSPIYECQIHVILGVIYQRKIDSSLLHAETFDFTFPTTAPQQPALTPHRPLSTASKLYVVSKLLELKLQSPTNCQEDETNNYTLGFCSTNLIYLTLNSFTSWHNNHPLWHTSPSIQSQTLNLRKQEPGGSS